MLSTTLRLLAVGLVLLLAVGFLATDANAQTADQEIGSRQGVSESLGTKDFDDDKLPGKLEIGIAMGSIVAVIAVMKYL
jgi:hypothetical protein